MIALCRASLSVLLLAAASGAPARADEDCGDRDTTVDIVQCLADEAAKWDRAVDAELRRVTSDATPEYVAAARAAQDLWIKYREANCLTYRLGEGTIAAVVAAECYRRMAEQRLEELKSDIEGAD